MPPKRKAPAQRTQRAKKRVVECAPLGDNPFGGHFDFSMSGDVPKNEWPPDMSDDLRKQTHTGLEVDVMGSLCVSLDIAFHDNLSVRKPISDNLLNERVEQGAKIRSIGWTPPQVFVPKKTFDAETGTSTNDPCADVRDYKEADGARLITKERKYLVVRPLHLPEGTNGRVYGRDDGVWRVRDIMCAILDSERHVRPLSEWFGGIDAHHVMLDYVLFGNAKVEYHFGS